MLSKQEPKPLTLSQMTALLLVFGSAATWLSWSWWNSKGLFKTPPPVERKVEHTDFTEGIKYIVPSVRFTSLVEDLAPKKEWAIEYSSDSAVMELNQKKKQLDIQKKKKEQLNHPRVPVISPFWQIDFSLPEGATGKTRDQAIHNYFVRNLEDSIIAEGGHLLPYARPDQEQQKVMVSSCANIYVECKVEERHDLVYFQVTTKYHRFIRAQLDYSPLVSVNLAGRDSPVYIGTKANALYSMRRIMQDQVKEILNQLRSQSVQVDFEQGLPLDPNYVPPIAPSSMSISTDRRNPNYVSPIAPRSTDFGSERSGQVKSSGAGTRSFD